MPAKFRFRLQPVLEMRERAEQQQQLRVAELESERLRLEEHLRAIQAELAGARRDLRDRLARPGEGGGIAAVRLQANTSLHTTLKAQRAAIELAGTLSRLTAARSDLRSAAAARQAVEKLKAKRQAEHSRMVRYAEDLDLDELTVMRHGRDDAQGALDLLRAKEQTP